MTVEPLPFEELVRRMRAAQREYWRSRLSSALNVARRLEKAVDDRLDPPKPVEDSRQMDLFKDMEGENRV